MTWEVSFEKFPLVSTFENALGYEMELDSSLMDAIKQIIDSGRGKTFAQGIKGVGRPFESKTNGNEHFILDIKHDNHKHTFLFKTGEKEKNKLVGISPEKITRDELVNLMYDVLSNRVEEANIVI